MSSVSILNFSQPAPDSLLLNLGGTWKIGTIVHSVDNVRKECEARAGIKHLSFDSHALTGWDSTFLTFIMGVIELCSRLQITVIKDGLPPGVLKLLALAGVPSGPQVPGKSPASDNFLVKIANVSFDLWKSSTDMLHFIGDAAVSFLRLLTGKARVRSADVFVIMQECGAQALPIVSAISVLVGVILAFVGAIQLKMFGAEIYVANIVGIAIVRVMGAIMTGVIMAGRTGAAFAAQLGTMQTNEEIDALKTLGISPMEFLVLPRMIALMLMMPLLCLYADLMGIFGGFVVGVGMLDLNPVEYYNQTKAAVHINNLWIGLFHSTVFGVLVALAGCMRGMQCGRSAASVGQATTSAVVTGIVSIVVATAVITYMCNILGI